MEFLTLALAMGSHQRWNKAKISCELTFKSSKFKIITRATSSIFISIRPSLTRFTNGAYGFLTRCIHVWCIFRHHHWHILNMIYCLCYTVEEFHRILDNSVFFSFSAPGWASGFDFWKRNFSKDCSHKLHELDGSRLSRILSI